MLTGAAALKVGEGVSWALPNDAMMMSLMSSSWSHTIFSTSFPTPIYLTLNFTSTKRILRRSSVYSEFKHWTISL